MQKTQLLATFRIPLIIFLGILAYLFFRIVGQLFLANSIAVIVTILGSYQLFVDTFQSMLERRFALDYIAIIAIVVSLITGEYIVAAVIALMLSSGQTLEEYGVSQARRSLTQLADRIPDEVVLWQKNRPEEKVKKGKVTVGQEILIRKGEVIALDGILVSENGLTDESSLTGEPYMIEKIQGDLLRSGTINVGDAIVLKVTQTEANSTYNKILHMVQEAQGEKAPLVRLADKYSTIFTLITLAISVFAYITSNGSLTRVLAVLVVATPCPLILATPIALLGGVNAAAKKRIIIKKLASIESLARIRAIIFDKTGTITLGKPQVISLTISDKSYSQKEILAIAEAIERNSLHPLAKAIVIYASEHKAPIVHAANVEEKIGTGIYGTVEKKRYILSKVKQATGMMIELTTQGKQLAVFTFADEIKATSKQIIKDLKEDGLEVFIYTGDKKQAAEEVVKRLGEQVTVYAECTPEDKRDGIVKLKKEGKLTAMVGDGINDAPALALADVGMVFSNEEQTAASEAADIVFLGGEFTMVTTAYSIAKRTIQIAMQSILWGIGLSIVSMVFASVGFIPPLVGAGIQEGIDVAVILNALRASR